MAGKATETDSTTVAQGRFVVSLPAEVGTQVDAIGARLASAMYEQTGVAFELTRSQVVQALVKSALSSSNGASDAGEG